MSSPKKVYISCKDYSVSNETFDLVLNPELEMLETFPQPSLNTLGSYYESSDYISHTDAKETLIDKMYQFVKKYTLSKKLKLIDSFKTSSKRLLDVGCGTGDFLSLCETYNWEVVGVEPNNKAQKLASSKLKSTSLLVNDLFELNESIEKFDVITLWHVLEHVPNLEEYISKLKSLLRPNGVLVIAVPNYNSFDAKHYKQFWAAYDVPRHLWHFSQKSIELLFSKQQLEVKKTHPMVFDSFYVSLLSEKYKNGKSNFLSAFFVGLRSNFKAMASNEYSSLIYVLKND